MKYLLILLLLLAIFIISVTLGKKNEQQLTFNNYLLNQGKDPISSLITLLFTTGFKIQWLITVLVKSLFLNFSRVKHEIKPFENHIAPAAAIPVTME